MCSCGDTGVARLRAAHRGLGAQGAADLGALGGGAPGGGAQPLSVRSRVCVCETLVSHGHEAVRPPQHGAGWWPQKGMSTS